MKLLLVIPHFKLASNSIVSLNKHDFKALILTHEPCIISIVFSWLSFPLFIFSIAILQSMNWMMMSIKTTITSAWAKFNLHNFSIDFLKLSLKTHITWREQINWVSVWIAGLISLVILTFKSEVRHETYSANQFGFPIFLKGSAKVCKQVFRKKMNFVRK